ncbi:MAG: MBL fold metallo-hydrolase [Gammaproteobacteria bacterium]|nr:MBL fold metallo-hydrolase [Gammaproteobacteria bacterium]
MIHIASLGSGSKGNGTLIKSDSTCVLVDCGFGLREATRRLKSKGVEPESLDAIIVTHEHSDHSGGVEKLARKYQLPVWLTPGTHLHRSCADIVNFNYCLPEQAFQLGNLTIQPFTVPHDAREPAQFIFSSGDVTVGLLTDVGHITYHIIETLSSCDGLLLEFNHCPERLWNGNYPYPLKQRVGGDLGHLSNHQSLELLSRLDHSKLKVLVAMHLSGENNCPDLVQNLISEQFPEIPKVIAEQTTGTDWITVNLS